MKKVLCVDASSLKHASCGRKLLLTVGEGLRVRKESNDLLYGTCFHLAAELVAKGKSPFEANEAALAKWDSMINDCEIKSTARFLDRKHLAMTLTKFFMELQTNDIFTQCPYIKIGDTALAECKFSIPLYSDDEVDVLIQGTMDGVFQIAKGCPALGDWKTTRARDPEDYFYGYKMSTQLRTYRWAIDWYKKHYPTSPFAKAFEGAPKVGAFIYGAFLSAKDGVEFKRSQVFQFSDSDMLNYTQMLNAVVTKLVIDWKRFTKGGDYPLAEGIINGHCQVGYGSNCTFYHACSSCVGLSEREDSKLLFETILSNNFKKTDYRPLEFGGGDKKNKQHTENIK
jgi:hypothetical protein